LAHTINATAQRHLKRNFSLGVLNGAFFNFFSALQDPSLVLSWFVSQLTTSNFLIGLIMGVLMAVGFSVVGLKFGALLGIVLGLLNIIPYLGSILGLITTLPLAYLQQDGGFTLLAMVLGVFAAVQLIEGNILTPRIMGQSTGLHPLMVILSIFFWGKALNGILGMIMAIPLTAFFVVVWRLLRKKYLVPAGKPAEQAGTVTANRAQALE